MLDQAFDAAKRRRALHNSNGTGDRGVFALLDPDRQHAAEAARHLLQRDVVTGVALDAGIEHRR